MTVPYATSTSIAATPTDRTAVRQEYIARAVPQCTGLPAPQITEWTCVHGDFHAANLTARATILDWEGWGIAPRGYDAATLCAYAQLAPTPRYASAANSPRSSTAPPAALPSLLSAPNCSSPLPAATTRN
ncbi:aminoglycoside phosphotransferase family protein [Streptomyces sp. NBC_01261]|uniref:phosphotransferase n=1 Tax=Streptomyces sp. NBC_01261 TaxID=2903802 RepID=UPI002E378B8C|nr:phosphotransferase [Streptomyces sp. NBC_01261]